MTLTLDVVKSRLQSFNYTATASDNVILTFEIEKVTNTIKNECNVSEIPDGLTNIAIDMVCGNFLNSQKTFSPDSLTMIDLTEAVKQIQAGDTNTVFATGDGSLTDEQRLDAFIDFLQNHGRDEFNSFRCIRW